MQNDLTPNLGLPLPHPGNELEDDVLRLRDALSSLDTAVGALQTLVSSNDLNLDTVQEIVNLLKSSQGQIGDITTLLASKASASQLAQIEVTLTEQLGGKASSNHSHFVDEVSGALKKSGDTMSGPLTLSGDPEQDLHAVPRRYVDSLTTKIFTAYGAISAGQPVSYKATDTVIGAGIEPAEVGSKANYAVGSAISPHKVVYDPVNDALVVFYSVGSTGYALVGKVSSSGITFGSPVQFCAVTGYIDACFDVGSGKVVAFWIDPTSGQNFGKAAVGTVSGSSISFGSVATAYAYALYEIRCVYEPVAQRIAIFMVQPGSGLNYGVTLVGTVSGSSISFGSANQFNGSSYTQSLRPAYDAAAQKIVLGWRKGQVGENSYIQLFTISGTALSNGGTYSPGDYRVYPIDMVYDANAGCCLYTYVDQANGNLYRVGRVVISGGSISSLSSVVTFPDAISASVYVPSQAKTAYLYVATATGYVQVIYASVSGGVISLDTPIVVINESASAPVVAYNSATMSLIVSARDGVQQGYALTYKPPLSNVQKWLGIAKASAADGHPVPITIIGGLDDHQSGLTAGADYYLSSNGTLTKSSGGPKIGYAVSSSKLLITGGAR